VEKILGNCKCGFRISRLYTVTEADSEKRTLEYGVGIFHLFTDSKAACNTINKRKLLAAVKGFKIPQKLTGLVREVLKHATCRVKNAELSIRNIWNINGLKIRITSIRKGGQKVGDRT
jgi:hypothetical protein